MAYFSSEKHFYSKCGFGPALGLKTGGRGDVYVLLLKQELRTKNLRSRFQERLDETLGIVYASMEPS